MSGAVGAKVARLVQRVIGRIFGRIAGRISGRISGLRLARRRGPEPEAAERDPFAAYWTPPRRSREPPYASLRQ